MSESDPSQGRPGSSNEAPLEGRIVRPEVESLRNPRYDPAAPEFTYLSSQDHSAALRRQDGEARADLQAAIRGGKVNRHPRHALTDPGVRPDQAVAMRAAKTLKQGHR